jgi:hypothetical protein
MIRLKFFYAFALALLLYSCQYTDSDFKYNVGNDFVQDPVKVFMIDTLTVNTYTTAIDSIYSSRNTRFMVGRTENISGIVTTCESYFRFDPVEEQGLHPSSVFESASLILNLDGYSFGDTTKICTMEIYNLTEDITVDKETEYIYNTTQFTHETTPLTSFSVDLTNDKLDSLVIELPYDFGKKLFDLAFNSDTILSDADLFKAKYKGFLIKPTDDNISCVVGFIADPDSISSPRIMIRYHDNSLDDNLSFNYEIEKHETPISNTENDIVNYYGSNYFVNDYSKLTGTAFPTGESKLSSTKTGNATFLQGGLNLRTRIEIPTINKLYYLGVGSVIKAELYFQPVKGTFKNISDLPKSLEMYLINDKNQIDYEKYMNGQMSLVGSSDIAYAVLHYNEEFKNETYYSFDITKYVVDEYLDKGDPVYSLLMSMPQSGINGNVDQLIIGDQHHPTNKMKLKVYLATY